MSGLQYEIVNYRALFIDQTVKRTDKSMLFGAATIFLRIVFK